METAPLTWAEMGRQQLWLGPVQKSPWMGWAACRARAEGGSAPPPGPPVFLCDEVKVHSVKAALQDYSGSA